MLLDWKKVKLNEGITENITYNHSDGDKCEKSENDPHRGRHGHGHGPSNSGLWNSQFSPSPSAPVTSPSLLKFCAFWIHSCQTAPGTPCFLCFLWEFPFFPPFFYFLHLHPIFYLWLWNRARGWLDYTHVAITNSLENPNIQCI